MQRRRRAPLLPHLSSPVQSRINRPFEAICTGGSRHRRLRYDSAPTWKSCQIYRETSTRLPSDLLAERNPPFFELTTRSEDTTSVPCSDCPVLRQRGPVASSGPAAATRDSRSAPDIPGNKTTQSEQHKDEVKVPRKTTMATRVRSG